MEITTHKPSYADTWGAGTAEMLDWIRRIVAFGIRPPGYSQGLQVEHWLQQTLREFGLAEVRQEPVPLNFSEPSVTTIAVAQRALELPCFPVPYTPWTA